LLIVDEASTLGTQWGRELVRKAQARGACLAYRRLPAVPGRPPTATRWARRRDRAGLHNGSVAKIERADKGVCVTPSSRQRSPTWGFNQHLADIARRSFAGHFERRTAFSFACSSSREAEREDGALSTAAREPGHRVIVKDALRIPSNRHARVRAGRDCKRIVKLGTILTSHRAKGQARL
jgi:hypothetical protein